MTSIDMLLCFEYQTGHRLEKGEGSSVKKFKRIKSDAINK